MTEDKHAGADAGRTGKGKAEAGLKPEAQSDAGRVMALDLPQGELSGPMQV